MTILAFCLTLSQSNAITLYAENKIILIKYFCTRSLKAHYIWTNTVKERVPIFN